MTGEIIFMLVCAFTFAFVTGVMVGLIGVVIGRICR